ncbi:MAG: alanine--tRNA ligase [Epulopiscium sp.]|nr:alanine--tRNA ligase [Candidatus Epulonipiscium sp.]
MKNIGLNELREKYLAFFESKNHLRMKSFPLVPQHDNSLLLINAGMAPLKPYFTGQETPPRKRVTTCQKCIRTGDIENVGKTARHATFFEMLGNFSFGDYFKKEAIEWAWEFTTTVLELPQDRVYISVYEEDDEAYQIWNQHIGVSEDHIVRMGKEDNFWELGVGPCGPCSELYYDRGEKYGCGSPDCTVGCECDRFMEFWNLVFTQFNKDEDGNYHPLEHPNIDTGMGLERLAAMMQDVPSIFDIDTIKAIRDRICDLAGVVYQEDPEMDVSIRIVTDHIRSVTFMTSDGILPSNEGRGYVLRRLLRRAARHGKRLGIKGMFLADISSTVIELSKNAYPELEEKQEYIYKVLSVEEERFNETIDQGLAILESYIKELKEKGTKVLSGKKCFKLYDTYGFPFDLTKEILEEVNMKADEIGFQKEMSNQKDRARNAREESNYMGAKDTIYHHIDPSLTTEFIGYKHLETDNSHILTIVSNDNMTKAAKEGDEVTIFVDRTPFYAASGGQVGDQGIAKTTSGKVKITDCIYTPGKKMGHIGKVIQGTIHVGEPIYLKVDEEQRMATTRNHSATHLLQKALRDILGNHVEQAGSHVSSNRLRFDFTHFSPLSEEELKQVEKHVNESILKAFPISIFETNMEEARKLGAVALFGEKYGDIVRVVNMGDHSIELCGGCHLSNTAQVGVFKILSEAGIAAGVRRIEAVTGQAALEYYQQQENQIKEIAQLVKTTPDYVGKKIESLLSDMKEMQKELDRFKTKMAQDATKNILDQKQEVKGIAVLAVRLDNMDMNSLRTMGDQLKDKLKSGVIILAGEQEDKVVMITMATDDVIKRGIHAGNIVKAIAPIVGGGGGGRPQMAQAGGKDASKINEALQKAIDIIAEQVK